MKKKRVIVLALGFILLLGLAVVGYVGYGIVRAFSSDNEADNNDPKARKKMAIASCEWGRLAEFPSTKRDYSIKTEGSSFTRSFRDSFSDTPERIQKWLLDSPGV